MQFEISLMPPEIKERLVDAISETKYSDVKDGKSVCRELVIVNLMKPDFLAPSNLCLNKKDTVNYGSFTCAEWKEVN